MTNKKKSSLSTSKSISKKEITNDNAIKNLKNKREKNFDQAQILKNLLQGDIAALSRAITLVESDNPKHSKIANYIVNTSLQHTKKSIRIGITGIPGVGKSTFIEAFGKHLTTSGKKVAVLAIDPSSSITKGSILGDKTRMESLVKDKSAYIRPSASGDSLGGVARKTRESIILCEAAGYDVIIVETVGVGQGETMVHSMVDFFLLLKLSGAGDELQGIKRGIIEMADAIVINKADGDNKQKAELAKVEFSRALHLYPEKSSGWQPKVTTCSALQNENIDNIWKIITDYLDLTTANGFFIRKRKEQNKFWLLQTIESRLKTEFYKKEIIKQELPKQLELIEKNKITPFEAADYLLKI